MIDEKRRQRLYRSFEAQHGEDVAVTLVESLLSVDHVTKADLEPFATKTDLERFATKTDLEPFATKTDLERFATKTDLEPFATKTDLESFATKTDLERFPTKTDLESFATKADLYKALHAQTWGFVGGTAAIVGLATWIGQLLG